MPLGLRFTWNEHGTLRLRQMRNSPFHIGRTPDADIAFPNDANLSRLHARIEPNGNGWRVVDLESKNGTFVNGIRVENSSRISPGDQLQCGNQAIYLHDCQGTYVVRCPNCSQKLRLPASHESVHVMCARCSKSFNLLVGDDANQSTSGLKAVAVPRESGQVQLFSATERSLVTLGSLLKRHPSLADLLARTERIRAYISQPLTLLVAGPFNSGKSTLINCLLGARILPSDVTPTTAVPTILSYAVSPRLVATYNNREQEMALSDLADFGTEDSKRGAALRAGLVTLSVQMPAHILQYITIIDSPGLHSLNTDHSKRTGLIRSEADEVLWVTSCAQAGSAAEVEDLQRFKGRFNPLVVANQLDLLGEEEEADLALERMQVRLGLNSASMIGLSARFALEGLEANDKDLIRRSRWPIFHDNFVSTILPNRYARRFSVAYEEILKLLNMLEEKLQAEVIELEQRESKATDASKEVQNLQTSVYALTTAAGNWKSLNKSLSGIGALDSDEKHWLTISLKKCRQVFDLIVFPPNIDMLPLPQAREWQSNANRLLQMLRQLDAQHESYVAKAIDIEQAQETQALAESTLRDRQAGFKQRNSIIQVLSFRCRTELEEEELRTTAERGDIQRRVERIRVDAQAYVDSVNHLIRDYVNFISSGQEAIMIALKDGENTLSQAQSRLDEAERRRALQSWARPTTTVFMTDVQPSLLKAAVHDTVAARWLFERF